MKLGWVLGWAVPEAWFVPLACAAFPAAEHVCAEAGPDALGRLEAAAPFDAIAGYSLGSLLLLREPERAARLGRVALLAPIWAFPRERERGGRVALAELKLLARRLRTDPAAALAGFYARAGIDVPAGAAGSATALAWGLERLEEDVISPALPSGWRAWCGADDALLDAVRLKALVPAVEIVPGATHHPAALLRAFAAAA